jgi:uncharacterized protein (DUF433 family)
MATNTVQLPAAGVVVGVFLAGGAGTSAEFSGGQQIVTGSSVVSAIGVPSRDTLIAALIEKTDGVVGGSARIARTRVPVWTLVNHKRLGATDSQILDAFPFLRAVDLEAAWAYLGLNKAEIERDIAANEDA